MAHTREQFSLKDNSFIAAVASSLRISSSKVTSILYFPPMCDFSLSEGLQSSPWVVIIGISRYVPLFSGDEIYQASAPSSAHELCNECWERKDPGGTS